MIKENIIYERLQIWDSDGDFYGYLKLKICLLTLYLKTIKSCRSYQQSPKKKKKIKVAMYKYLPWNVSSPTFMKRKIIEEYLFEAEMDPNFTIVVKLYWLNFWSIRISMLSLFRFH